MEHAELLGRLLPLPMMADRTSMKRRVFRAAVLVVVANGVALSLFGAVTAMAPSAIRSRDFLQEYVLARSASDHSDPYASLDQLAEKYLGPGPGAVLGHPTNHPPPVGLFFLPFASVDYPTASVAWLVAEILCLAWSAYLLAGLVNKKPMVRRVALVFLLLLAWSPTGTDLALGQVMIPILTLLCGSLVASKRGRPELAGFLLGLAIALKPTPLPLVALFAFRREWRALATCLGTVVIAYAAAGAVYGLDRLQFWALIVLPTTGAAYRGFAANQSLWTVGWRLFEGTTVVTLGKTTLIGLTAAPLIPSHLLAVLVSTALPAVILGASLVAAWKSEDRVAAFSLLSIASVLVSPISWVHYLVLVSIPVAWLFGRLTQLRFPILATASAGLAILAVAIPLSVWALLALALAGKGPPDLSSAVPIADQLSVPLVISGLTMLPSIAVSWLLVLIVRLDRQARPEAID